MVKEPVGEFQELKNRIDAYTKMGISVQSIADGSGVNYTALRKWLRECRPLKVSQAEAIEKYMEDFKQRIVQI